MQLKTVCLEYEAGWEGHRRVSGRRPLRRGRGAAWENPQGLPLKLSGFLRNKAVRLYFLRKKANMTR